MANYATLKSTFFGSSSGATDGKPMICTEESQTTDKNKKYSADLKKNRIEKITLVDGSLVYWIAPELFEDYYRFDSLQAPIVYLGCCRNYCQDPENTDMVAAINDAGASAVLGYSSSVSVGYDNRMVATLVDELLDGNTVEEALETAKEINGEQDDWLDSGWNVHAELNLYGSNEAILYHNLNNGKFDSSFNWLGNGLYQWETEGDARSIYKLSGISPRSNPKMAIISSGFGSMNGESESFIYQTFLVPEDANSISFSYDVVSEEPMEFVGSDYNDSFTVELLDTDGNLLDTLAYESVNSSSWYEVTGINFPGGDDTTFHTRWTNVTSTTISKYRGKLVVLRISVEDAGDSIYDTAALIDSITIN